MLKQFFQKYKTRLAIALFLGAAPLVMQPTNALGGPGIGDAAVFKEGAEQCSLPPFLNVALAERPNIMLLYDNSTSMSLQAFSREYNPETDYYGLFNADTCYRYDGSKFTKHPDYPEVVREEVINGKTVGFDNKPAIDPNAGAGITHNKILETHNNQHFCTDPLYAFSGNFLNWATMRRVDLLRRAFTYGDGTGGAGQRPAPSIQGEQAFTPCYNKSYNVPYSYARKTLGNVPEPFYVVPEDHMNVRSVYGRVVGGDITFGHSCAAGDAVTSDINDLLKEVLPERASSLAAVIDETISPATREFTQGPDSAFEDPLADILDRLFNRYDRPKNYQMVDLGGTTGQSEEVLTSTLGSVAPLIIGAPGDPDLQLVSWTLEDSSGNPANTAQPGDALKLTLKIKSYKKFTANASSIVLLTIANNSGVNAGSTQIPLASTASCPLPTINNNATATVVCDYQIPAGWLASDFPLGSYIGVFVNPDNKPSEDTTYANIDTKAFHLFSSAPDLLVNSLTVTPIDRKEATATFNVVNGGPATGNFDVSLYLSDDGILNTADDKKMPIKAGSSAACSAATSITAGGTIAYTCKLDLQVTCGGGGCTIGKTYTVFVVVDELHATLPPETAYDNNTQQTSMTIPGLLLTPELQLIDLAVPGNASIGAPIAANFKVKNNGPLASVATTVDLFIIIGGVKFLLATCPLASVPALTTAAQPPCVGNTPATLSDNTFYEIMLAINYLDDVPANNAASQSVLFKKSNFACVALTACQYNVEINFFGRRRTGLLWMFNKKELGHTAPANIGVARFDYWNATGTIANNYPGVDGNQGNNNNFVAQLEKDPPKSQGKIASSLLNVLRYYQNILAYKSKNSDPDPFLYDEETNSEVLPANAKKCRKNYILLISDGLSFEDNDALSAWSTVAGANIDLKKYGAHLSDPTEVPAQPMLDEVPYSTYYVPNANTSKPMVGQNGTYHGDNVALYGNMLDQRKDLAGTQTVQTLVVHTFADSGTNTTNFDRGVRLMKRTAINGSFVERDGTPGPTSNQEWDQDGDGRPDGYFPANEGTDLGEVILAAINSILLKTASGTSVSVIASSTRGEGAVYQSYFRPTTAENGREISWIGFLQALWVDNDNNLREDTDLDGGLSLTKDRIIEYEYNTMSRETFAILKTTDADGNVVSSEGPISLSAISPIFEAGKLLHSRAPDDRKIYTWAHGPAQVVPTKFPIFLEKAEVDNCGADGACLKQAMWPSGNTYYNDVAMTENLVEWVRGKDVLTDDTFRKRTITVGGVENTWKLGDIVYSTPTVVGSGEERYDLLYGGAQDGYTQWFIENKDRRRMVYVGANDGMLHAFNGGVFRSGDNPSTGYKELAWYDKQGVNLGEEVWAYTPGSLLANLRMLADAGYSNTCHVYFVDLKPKVTDVQIFFTSGGDPIDDTYHKNGWGTILIGGMRLGCGKTEFASYFILDISNPEEPFLLAEFGDTSVVTSGSLQPAGVAGLGGLDFTFFYPTVLRVADTSTSHNLSDGTSTDKAGKWYMFVGSGPNKLTHTSDKAESFVYTFDLSVLGERNGNTPPSLNLEDFAYAHNKFGNGTALPAKTVISNGITADLDADFSVDVAYVSAQHDVSTALDEQWRGSLWRLNTFEKPDPTAWELTRLFDADKFNGVSDRYQSLTASPSITRDDAGNIWIYMGTGRFIYKSRGSDLIDDVTYGTNSTAFQQALYGVIDPCWNPDLPCAVTLPLDRGDLVHVSNYEVNLDTAKKESLACASPAVAAPAGCEAVPACDTLATCTTDGLASHIANTSAGNFGWYRYMADYGTTWEMSYNKPAVAGGLVLYTTYAPSQDPAACTVAGDSYLYILKYTTGTASKEDVFSQFDTTATVTQTVSYKDRVGAEPPSPPSIFGKQIFVQGSNAKITGIKTDAQFRLPPHIRNWQED